MVWHELRQYAFAFMTVVVALAFDSALDRYISGHVSPPYFLAVMLSAAYAGAGPGLLATLLASLSVAWFDLGSAHKLDLGVDDVILLAVFATTALIISSISAARESAERELRSALAKLAALDRSKDEFIARVSHELRTPLTSILGWLQILRAKDVDVDSEMRTMALQTIEQSAKTQAMLVSDMLDASRIVLGKLHVDQEPLFVREAVKDAVAVINPDAEAKNVSLEVEGLEMPILVNGDRDRLKQVVWNFLSNAVKFTSPAGSVRVRLLADQHYAIIEVSDDGQGIEQDLLPVVFERFTQGSDGVRKGGLGLGLSIAQHIVQLHGGSVTAHSAGNNRGASFIARIPLLGDSERRRLEQMAS